MECVELEDNKFCIKSARASGHWQREAQSTLSAIFPPKVVDRLLDRYTSFAELAQSSRCNDLGLDDQDYERLKAVFNIPGLLFQERISTPFLYNGDSRELARLFRTSLQLADCEEVHVAFFDSHLYHTKTIGLASGTLSSVSADPSLIFKHALQFNATAIVVAHNHTSCSLQPSKQDLESTRRLIRAGVLMKIQVLDHLILGTPHEGHSENFLSLRSYLSFEDEANREHLALTQG